MSDEVIPNPEIISGKFYWIAHWYEKIWRVCYISEDSDGMQWIEIVGQRPVMLLKMDLRSFTIIEIDAPSLTEIYPFIRK
jgi:hypothetical protein